MGFPQSLWQAITLFLLEGLFFVISGLEVILNFYRDSCTSTPQYMFGK